MDMLDSSYDAATDGFSQNSSETSDSLVGGDASTRVEYFDGQVPASSDPAADETSTEVYADVMRDVPLLTPEEEEQLGKTVNASRIEMTQALSNIPAANRLVVKRFGEVERGERPRTDVFFAPVQNAALRAKSASAAKSGSAAASRPSTESRWSWRETGKTLGERLRGWESRRDRAAAMRLAQAFRELEPGFVVLREALEKCEALDGRARDIESAYDAFQADRLAESEFGDSDDSENQSLSERSRMRKELDVISTQAGTDLVTLRECCQAAASAYGEYRRARARMVNANLRLAHYLAYRLAGNGVAIEDLVQEAIIGLMRAVDRFDYRLGFKFSTYAYHWIRQTTTLAIAEASRTVRVAPHMHDRIRRLRKLAAEIEQRMGRNATSDELVEASDLTPAQVTLAIEAARAPASFDAPLPGAEDSTLHTLLSDSEQPDPSDLSDNAKLKEKIAVALDSLPPREAFILRLRYGVGVREPHTLENIGARLGITRERTRQLEGLALAKLREQMSEVTAVND